MEKAARARLSMTWTIFYTGKAVLIRYLVSLICSYV
jgi:hypothetical protein